MSPDATLEAAQIDQGVSGSTYQVAADQESGGNKLAQILKLAVSADGDLTRVPADAANGMDVDVTRMQYGTPLEVTGPATSATTNNILVAGGAANDVTGYRSWSLHLRIGNAGNVVIVEGSNDNTNWARTNVVADDGSFAGSGLNADGLYSGAVSCRYLRVRCATYVSGTINSVAEFSRAPANPRPTLPRVANLFKPKTAGSVTAGSGVTLWTPTTGKRVTFMVWELSADTACQMIFYDNTVGGTELFRSPTVPAGATWSTPANFNWYTLSAVSNVLKLDVTVTASVTGYVGGCED